jgi:hypothetical protein
MVAVNKSGSERERESEQQRAHNHRDQGGGPGPRRLKGGAHIHSLNLTRDQWAFTRTAFMTHHSFIARASGIAAGPRRSGGWGRRARARPPLSARRQGSLSHTVAAGRRQPAAWVACAALPVTTPQRLPGPRDDDDGGGRRRRSTEDYWWVGKRGKQAKQRPTAAPRRRPSPEGKEWWRGGARNG